MDCRPGRILYLEPSSGISGDMLLGALLDLGIELARLEEELRRLPFHGYTLALHPCSRAGIRASKFHVHCEDHGAHSHHHRSFKEIREMIAGSDLTGSVRGKSVAAFHRLAEAEGRIHSRPPDDVHFHEVGAIDSIVDIVGSMIALEELMPVRVISAAVNVGQGTLECRHGIYPAPAPATVELLKGCPVYTNAVSGELTTPTGAALLVALAESFGSLPPMCVERIGYGAGDREIPGAANVLRATLGNPVAQPPGEPVRRQVAVIEASVDDMSPQLYGHFLERALAAGALDVSVVAAQMKKNRPGMQLTLLCSPEQLDAMAGLIFAETTTIGIRYTFAERRTLDRAFQQVQTEFGAVTIKVSSVSGTRLNFAPEYESCRRLALEKHVALKDVMAAASRAYLEFERPGPSSPGRE